VSTKIPRSGYTVQIQRHSSSGAAAVAVATIDSTNSTHSTHTTNQPTNPWTVVGKDWSKKTITMRPKLTASSPTARRSIASVSVPSSDPADLSTYTAPSPPSPPSAAHIRKLKGAMLANLNTNELACLLARIFLRCPEAYDVLLEQ